MVVKMYLKVIFRIENACGPNSQIKKQFDDEDN